MWKFYITIYYLLIAKIQIDRKIILDTKVKEYKLTWIIIFYFNLLNYDQALAFDVDLWVLYNYRKFLS